MQNPETGHQVSAFPVTFLLLLNLLVLASGGLGLVWLRQETSASAQRSQAMEHELALCRQRTGAVEARVASLTQPESLLRLARHHGLRLEPARPEQWIRLPADSIATHPTDDLVLASAPGAPFFRNRERLEE